MVTIRRHQGIVLLMRFHKAQGPFCRHCGMAFFRDWTTATLWQGWWTPFSLVAINLIMIINNLAARAKLLKLPEPDPRYRRTQVMPGRPVTRRWVSLVGLTPVLWVALVIVAQMTKS